MRATFARIAYGILFLLAASCSTEPRHASIAFGDALVVVNTSAAPLLFSVVGIEPDGSRRAGYVGGIGASGERIVTGAPPAGVPLRLRLRVRAPGETVRIGSIRAISGTWVVASSKAGEPDELEPVDAVTEIRVSPARRELRVHVDGGRVVVVD
jgi:hypothetical protein